MDDQTSESQSQTQSPQRGEKADKPIKAFSCLRCFERKVKCDKSHPCANCVKSNVECIFRIPSAPRRKKKRATEEVLLERLKRAEDLLRSKGILNDSHPSQPSQPSQPHPDISSGFGPLPQGAPPAGLEVPDPSRTDGLYPLVSSRDNFLTKGPYAAGKLIVSHGRSRFVDNNLWTSVSDEFAQTKDGIDDWSDDSDDETLGDDSGDIILGLTPSSSSSITHLHPTSDNLFKLWGVFLDNINPMTKIIHRPSLEKQLIQATKDLENIPRGLECLMFAIYVCAVGSMSEEECEKMFGESQKTLFARYRTGCRRALARAKFLGSGDLLVCQSFVLYVLIMREVLDSRTIWTLSGVANRMAQGLGLHRDGAQLGLPVFETELRRRLWWQLTILDFRSAELTGSGRFGDFWSDTSAPRNIDDVDFWPGITEQEFEDRIKEKGEDRATEMITCLLRCEFGAFWREKLIERSKHDTGLMKTQLFSGKPPSPWDVGLKERDETISELERRLEEKFLRYCDVNVPQQFMASIIGRGAVASMRLMAHHPRRWPNEADIPDEERRLLWKISIKLLESDILCHSTRALQRFMWHTDVYFQWQALVYLLGELKKKHTGDEADHAWRKIEEVYHHHPAFIVEFRKPLHAAVGSLCLKAWDARMRGRAEAQERGEFLMPLQMPDFIEMLREQRRAPKRKSTTQSGSKPSTTPDPNLTQITPTSSDASSGPPIFPAGNYGTYGAGGMSGVLGRQPVDMSMMWDANNLPAFGGNQFSYDPMQMFDPSTGLVPGAATNDVQMDMDWNQWDYLIQEYDITHRPPASGPAGGPSR